MLFSYKGIFAVDFFLGHNFRQNILQTHQIAP